MSEESWMDEFIAKKRQEMHDNAKKFTCIDQAKLDRIKALADLVVKDGKTGALLEILEIAMGKMCGSCSRVADSEGNHPCAVCEHVEWNKIIAEAKKAGGLT